MACRGFNSPERSKAEVPHPINLKKIMKFKRKLKIENATAFKLEYTENGKELRSKEFNSYKAMEQFHSRQKNFHYLDYHRYAMIDGEWHRFIKLDTPFIFGANLEVINKNFEDFNPQKL